MKLSLDIGGGGCVGRKGIVLILLLFFFFVNCVSIGDELILPR